MTRTLQSRVAVVTGASRGVGKGVALALGDAGATVYVTGRTTAGTRAYLPGTIDDTAALVTARGGRGVAVRCDHEDDAQVAALFERVASEAGRLDVLVNNAFKLPRISFADKPFWELPLSVWDDMHAVGLRSHYVASVHAAPLMIGGGGGGLIANISSLGGGHYVFGVAYGVGKAGVDRLAADMAHELADHGVAVVSLWPGVVKTERMKRLAAFGALPFGLEGGETPEFTGRAVVALAGDPEVMARSGRVLVVEDLAREYGFTDVDGSRPDSVQRVASAREEADAPRS